MRSRRNSSGAPRESYDHAMYLQDPDYVTSAVIFTAGRRSLHTLVPDWRETVFSAEKQWRSEPNGKNKQTVASALATTEDFLK